MRMHIANTAKFVIGIIFLLAGAGLFVFTRGERGFGQFRQAGLLCLVAAVVFGAMGLGIGS